MDQLIRDGWDNNKKKLHRGDRFLHKILKLGCTREVFRCRQDMSIRIFSGLEQRSANFL